MANENFTSGWAETDSDGVLSETSTTITVTGMNAAPNNCYLTKDQGAGFYSGDFEFTFGPINVSAASSNNSRFAPIKISMALDDGDDTEAQNLQVRWNNTATHATLYFSYFATAGLNQSAPTTEQSYSGAGVDVGASWYFRVKRTGTAAKLQIYSDSGLTTQLGSDLNITVGVHAYRYVHAAAKWDAGTGATVSATLQNLNLSASSDVTAPVLTAATGAANGARAATGSVTTDTAEGTLYSVLTTSATQPSVAQIKAGQNHTGSAAAYSNGGVTVTATGAQALAASSGLTPKTAYYWHSVHTDVAANDSNRLSSAAFTTHGEITDTDGDNTVLNGQGPVTINGFFGSSDPVVRIKSGSISQTQVDTGHTSTTITLSSIARGNLPYTDANHTHTIEVDTDE